MYKYFVYSNNYKFDIKKKIVRVYEYIVEGSHDIIFLIGPFQDDQIFKCV